VNLFTSIAVANDPLEKNLPSMSRNASGCNWRLLDGESRRFHIHVVMLIVKALNHFVGGKGIKAVKSRRVKFIETAHNESPVWMFQTASSFNPTMKINEYKSTF
jgi:hypothetical protein